MKKGYCFVLLIFLILLHSGASIHGVVSQDVYAISVCNGTISECLDENEEFLMESEISRRHLLVHKLNSSSPTVIALNPNEVVCEGNTNNKTYRECLSQPKGGTDRGCEAIYHCRRDIKAYNYMGKLAISP